MKKIILLLLFPLSILGQGYTSYFTGSTTNITTNPTFGICLMGGATENDNAMQWLLEKANGGDVVILRSTGGNGYNNYFYSGLGVQVNSVETLVITSIAGATSSYVLDKVANAELIWFAGGDQFDYVSYFKDNALEDIINNHVNVKHAPIGGTSAGMAILGSHYFSAQNGSVTSSQALLNPYNDLVTIGSNNFLNLPFMQNVITDTHFDNPNRKGRLITFLAKITTDEVIRSYGIASNEYVSVCVDENGKAKVFGDYPNYQEFAYFLQSNCQLQYAPETCTNGSPLTWNIGGEAVKVYKVPGTMNGNNYFQLSDWQNGFGGSWENWSVNNGVFSSISGSVSNCNLSIEDFSIENIEVFPVPFKDVITIKGLKNANIKLIDLNGKIVFKIKNTSYNIINTNNIKSGYYIISIEQNNKVFIKKIFKE